MRRWSTGLQARLSEACVCFWASRWRRSARASGSSSIGKWPPGISIGSMPRHSVAMKRAPHAGLEDLVPCCVYEHGWDIRMTGQRILRVDRSERSKTFCHGTGSGARETAVEHLNGHLLVPDSGPVVAVRREWDALAKHGRRARWRCERTRAAGTGVRAGSRGRATAMSGAYWSPASGRQRPKGSATASSACRAGRTRSSNPACGSWSGRSGAIVLVITRDQTFHQRLPARWLVPRAVGQAEGGHGRGVYQQAADVRSTTTTGSRRVEHDASSASYGAVRAQHRRLSAQHGPTRLRAAGLATNRTEPSPPMASPRRPPRRRCAGGRASGRGAAPPALPRAARPSPR